MASASRRKSNRPSSVGSLDWVATNALSPYRSLRMNKDQLQERLQNLGLDTDGKKEELITRLEEHDQQTWTELQASPSRSLTKQLKGVTDLADSPLATTSYNELRQKCTALGLPAGGKKTELIERLERYQAEKDAKRDASHKSPVRQVLFKETDKRQHPSATSASASSSSSAAQPKLPSPSSPRAIVAATAEEMENYLRDLRNRLKREVDELTLFRSPFATLEHFLRMSFDYLGQVIVGIVEKPARFLPLVILAASVLAAYNIEHHHTEYLRLIEHLVWWYGGWVWLGFLSSFGLGSGLHTFLLYLGPYIARIALRVNLCNSTNIKIADGYTHASQEFTCVTTENTFDVSPLELVSLVYLEAFCWGLGTAIGELPPFFLARAAARSGEISEEQAEVQNLSQQSFDVAGLANRSLVERLKIRGLHFMRNYGFFAILVLASFPNPLFDLAGIMSGFLQFNFVTFFVATFVGKAIIKVSIQTLFVAVVCSEHTLNYVLKYFPKDWREVVEHYAIQESKKYSDATAPTESTFAYVFEFLFYLVVILFVASIVQSLAKMNLRRRHRQVIERTKISLASQIKK